MAVHLVMRITFLLLLTYELAEAAPPPIAKHKVVVEMLTKFHTRLELDTVAT